MEGNLKNKIRFFSFGVIAGVTIGVVFGVAIKTMLGHFNDLSRNVLKIGTRQDEISQRLDSIQGEIANQNKKAVAVPIINNNFSGIPVTIENEKKPEKTGDSIKQSVDNSDTITIAKEKENNDDAVVMTNQLVSISSILLVDIDSTSTTNTKEQKVDSMIADLDEMPPVKRPANWRIEFWQSPLNFKGYKMSLDKIVLYGINSNIPFRFVKWNDVYYLVSFEDAYKVDFTDEVRPFDRVTDKVVLKKFNL